MQKILILLADVSSFYAALWLSLFLRYSENQNITFSSQLNAHLKPFTLVLVFWMLVFYLFDLYKEENLQKNISTATTFTKAMAVNIIVSVILFYLLLPILNLTPKTNLVIFTLIFSTLAYSLRLSLASFFIFKGLKNNIIFIGSSKASQETIEHLKANPQIGYNVKLHFNENELDKILNIKELAKKEKINTIVIQPRLLKNSEIAQSIYKLIPAGISIINFTDFYELIFKKIPLEEVEEGWFIEHIVPAHKNETLRNIFEFITSIILIIILLPLAIIIAIIIKLNSKGPIIYKQKRIGKNGKEFKIYKFRSMTQDAEKDGAKWSTPQDPRTTSFGKFLRFTHLDELPQLINILKGEVSFTGPRPERPEFVIKLEKEVPYYEIRHLAKPGITGWAQINYKYGSSIEDAVQKLQYDIYYLKNHSPVLDMLIIIKTIKSLFTNLK